MGKLAFWLSGDFEGGAQHAVPLEDQPTSNKLMRIIKGIPKLVLHPSFFPTLIFDCLLQRQLYRNSKSQWLIHALFFWSFIVLFFVGSMGNMLTERGWWSVTKDTFWFALVNEAAGAALVVGFIIVLVRRFVVKPQRLATGREDILFYILLAFSVLSGFMVEGTRIANKPILLLYFHDSGCIRDISELIPSLIGYKISGFIELINGSATGGFKTLYKLIWWFHALVSLTIVAIIPHTRLFHMFVSPVVLLLNKTVFSVEGAEGEPVP